MSQRMSVKKERLARERKMSEHRRWSHRNINNPALVVRSAGRSDFFVIDKNIQWFFFFASLFCPPGHLDFRHSLSLLFIAPLLLLTVHICPSPIPNPPIRFSFVFP